MKKNEFSISGDELLKKIKEIINEGNAKRIIIKDKNGNTYLEIPVTVGVAGLVLAPVFAAVGALAALVADFTIEIIHKGE
ncbi:MAG TPA: DUF4342 domain-containing protein [Bacteroidales bacterium]|nr:DUF4342 domain-containing protein [Bacteroidales bacterium]